MKERIVFIDNLKAFAIICVMLGHALQYLSGENPERLVSFNVIYTFHMPLFMMLSGYFAASSFQLPFRQFFKKKSIQLLLPAIAWSVCKIILSGGGNFLNNIVGSFWFLKSAFICYLITYIMLRIIKRRSLTYLLLFTLPLFCNINIGTYMLNYMLPSFVFGIWLKQHNQIILNNRKSCIAIALIIYVILLPLWNFSEYHYASIWQNGMFHTTPFLTCLHRIAIGLSGSLLLFSVFSYFTKSNEIILNIGASTLGIYVMNGIFSDIQRHLVHYAFDSELTCIAISVLLVLIQIPIFLFIIKQIKKIPIASLVLLGIKK